MNRILISNSSGVGKVEVVVFLKKYECYRKGLFYVVHCFQASRTDE